MVSTLEALERYPVPPSTAKLMTRGIPESSVLFGKGNG